MGRLDGRLTRIEQRLAPAEALPTFEVWYQDEDGLMTCDKTGERLPKHVFRSKYPRAFTIQIDRGWNAGEVYR